MKNGCDVCGLEVGHRIGLEKGCLFISLIFIWQPSINTWKTFPSHLTKLRKHFKLFSHLGLVCCFGFILCFSFDLCASISWSQLDHFLCLHFLGDWHLLIFSSDSDVVSGACWVLVEQAVQAKQLLLILLLPQSEALGYFLYEIECASCLTHKLWMEFNLTGSSSCWKLLSLW